MGQWVAGNHSYVDAYLGSAMPYVSTKVLENGAGPYKIQFPRVTKFIVVSNTGANPVRIGFTRGGVLDATPPGDRSYYLLLSAESTPALDIKCIDLWIYAEGLDAEFSIIAGYTSIPRQNFPNIENYDGV